MQLSIGCIDSPANIYLFKVKNKNWCEMFWNFTIKTSEQRQWCCNGVSIVNFEHISDLFLIFLLFTWNKQMLAGSPLTEEYMKEWNKSSEQNNIALSVESYGAHSPIENPSHLQLIFLTQNTVPGTQSVDQGARISFKDNYQKFMKLVKLKKISSFSGSFSIYYFIINANFSMAILQFFHTS